MANTCNLFIASRNRLSGTPSDFKVTLNPLITRVQSWYVNKVTLDYSWYNVRAGIDKFVFYEFPGVPITVTLTHGSPSSTVFLADLAAKMTASAGAGVYTAALDPSTNKITISSTVAFQVPSNVGSSFELMWMLGFVDPDTGEEQTPAPFALDQTAASVNHIGGGSNVYLYSSFLNMSNIGNNTSTNGQGMQKTNCVDVIPVNVNSGGTIQYMPAVPVVYNYRLDNFTTIDFQLFDTWGNAVPLNGGDLDIQITLVTFDN